MRKDYSNRKQNLQIKVNKFLEDYYLDVQGLSPNMTSLDEAYLARVLTKLAIGSATVWWSLLEIKEFITLHRKAKP
jgi:hypothetical protein